MKLRLLTGLSLMANLGLMFLLWTGDADTRVSSPSPSGVPREGAHASEASRSNLEPVAALRPEPLPWPPFRWEELADDDLTNYVANLRRVGCPEDTIGHIIRGTTWTDLMRRIHEKSVTMLPMLHRVFAEGREGIEELEAAMKPIEQAEEDRERLLAALLLSSEGIPDMGPAEAAMSRTRGRFPYVAEERHTELARIEEEWAKKVRETPRGPERRQIMAQLEKEKEAALREAMDGTEREEFTRRERARQNHGRFQALSLIALSPEELRGLVTLSNDELATALGPERMADLRRVTQVNEPTSEQDAEADIAVHDRFHDLAQVAARFDLPPSVPRAALDILRSYEAPLETIRKNPDLLPRERRQWVRAVEEERNRRMEGVFGLEAWETYWFHHGDW